MTLDAPKSDADLLALARQAGKRSTSAPYCNAVNPDAKPLRCATAPVASPYSPDMNGLELRRAKELEAMKQRGEIAAWWFTAITLRLAKGVRYTPDFMVQEMDGSLRLEETKGWMRDDARIKVRDCAQDYPFPLVVLYPVKGGGWKVEVVEAA